MQLMHAVNEAKMVGGNNIDGLKNAKRIFKVEINELDEINIDITMADGSLGNLVIKAGTLAQIIMDRNAREMGVVEPSTSTEIQVGDGNDGGVMGLDQSHLLIKAVDADELLMASKKRQLNNVQNNRL